MTNLVLGILSHYQLFILFVYHSNADCVRGMPDEINYPYYEQQLEPLERQRVELESVKESILRIFVKLKLNRFNQRSINDDEESLVDFTKEIMKLSGSEIVYSLKWKEIKQSQEH